MHARLLAVVLLLAAAVPATARAGYVPGEPTPASCAPAVFTDVIGTLDQDVVRATAGAQRLYGLTGDDWLIGSDLLPSCLFGGRDDDVLTLGAIGGVALGEDGDDWVTGGRGGDAVSGGAGADWLAGGAAADVVRGGEGVDGFGGGDGNDLLDAADGEAEVVDCGPGTDTALVDAADLTLSCEDGRRTGAPLPTLRAEPRRGPEDAVFRFRIRLPRAAGPGGYQVLGQAACAGGGLRELTAIPAPGRTVRAGRVARVGLRPPAGGWCRGLHRVLVVEQPPSLPAHPLARLVLRVH